MSVIRIEEIEKDNGSIEIKVDGVLDGNSRELLDKICRDYLENEKSVILNMEGVIHISREGREYLREIRDAVSFTETPFFMKFS